MIHGGAASVGCLAIGDRAAEELFALVAQTGLDNVELIISPWDFRATAAFPSSGITSLYGEIQHALSEFSPAE
jgi:hypothetical protein